MHAKSYARRLTTLKVFFGWLTAAEVLDRDSAAPLIHVHPTTPFPEVLSDKTDQRSTGRNTRPIRAAKPKMSVPSC